jgi:hypothetical protein
MVNLAEAFGFSRCWSAPKKDLMPCSIQRREKAPEIMK